MSQFDSRTAAEIGAVAAFGMCLLSILLWRARRTYPGFGRWVAGNCFCGASMAALAIRGGVPDWMSVLITNASAFAAVVLLLEGHREFLQLPARSTFARALAIASMLGQIVFLGVRNDIGVRIVIASVCLGTLTFASAMTLFRGIKPNRELGFIFAGLFFLANAAFQFTRGVATLASWPTSSDVFPATITNQLYFGGMTITVIGWSFGFILLTQDRIVDDLEAEKRRTALLNKELQQATEQAKAAAVRAERADQAKSEFLAYMSHEIRNPLSAMLMLSDLALDGPLTDQKRPEVETVRRSARAVLEIVNDILDVSKIEAGRISVTPAPFDLHTELVEIAELALAQARANSTAVVLIYAPNAPRKFFGDGRLVRQIVSNFAANSVKFTDHGQIEIRMDQTHGGVRISVCDTGIGVPPEAMQHLFERFIQGAESVRGTGLGLAIAKQLAELMGGKVGARSEPGRGSTFWVELPLTGLEDPSQDVGPSAVDGGIHNGTNRAITGEGLQIPSKPRQ